MRLRTAKKRLSLSMNAKKISITILSILLFASALPVLGKDKFCNTNGIFYCALKEVAPDNSKYCHRSPVAAIMQGINYLPSFSGGPGWTYESWRLAYNNPPSSRRALYGISQVLIYTDAWRNSDYHPPIIANSAEVLVYNCKLCPSGSTLQGDTCLANPAKDPANYGNSCNNSGHPINVSTGNKYYTEIDYQDPDFTISRAYNSLAKEWTFSYRQKLYLSSTPGQAARTAADGSSYYPHEVWAFRQDGKLTKHVYNGSYISSSPYTGERLQLLTPDFNNTLLSNAGDIYLRGSNGLLVIQNDQTVVPDHGNTHALLAGPYKELYNIKGRLTTIEQAGQPPIVLSYSDSAIAVSKEDRSLTMRIDAKGRVIVIKLPDDSGLAYSYGLANGSEVLLAVERTYGDGSKAILRRYLHEDTRFPTHITGVEDANGDRVSSVQYDGEGRAISSEVGPLGSGTEKTSIKYNSDGSRTITNALGKQSVQKFTQINGENRVIQVSGLASANCAAANQAYTYDTNGLLLSKTDWQGNTTTYRYNSQGQEISRTEAAGTPQARTVITEWHPTLFLPITVTEPSRITTYTYDDQGRQLSQAVTQR